MNSLVLTALLTMGKSPDSVACPPRAESIPTNALPPAHLSSAQETSAVYAAPAAPVKHHTSGYSKALIAHAVLFGLAFVILMPLGGIIMRLQRNRTGVTIHASMQLISLTFSIIGMGLGIWIALAFHKLDTAHAKIGLVLVSFLILQPVSGFLRKQGNREIGGRSPLAWVHVSIGRGVLLLGAINGGLGVLLAWETPGHSTSGAIAWGVLSGVMFVVYVAVVVLTSGRKGKAADAEASSSPGVTLDRKDSSGSGSGTEPMTETSPVSTVA